jgi:hypothetical protein
MFGQLHDVTQEFRELDEVTQELMFGELHDMTQELMFREPHDVTQEFMFGELHDVTKEFLAVVALYFCRTNFRRRLRKILQHTAAGAEQ